MTFGIRSRVAFEQERDVLSRIFRNRKRLYFDHDQASLAAAGRSRWMSPGRHSSVVFSRHLGLYRPALLSACLGARYARGSAIKCFNSRLETNVRPTTEAYPFDSGGSIGSGC